MINIKDALSIPGLKFRRFQDESDYPQIAAVISASERADQLEREVTARDVADSFPYFINCDLHQDLIIAEAFDEVIGYARGWWEETSTGRLYRHNGFLIPEWRRKGIGSAMLHWMEDHLRLLAADHPSGTARFFQASVTQFQTGRAAMLEQAGYQPVHYFYNMVRPTLDDIQEHPLPEGLEIRPVLPGHYPALWKSIAETSQDEWGYQEPTEEDYQQWLAGPHFQPQLWQVIWESGTDRIVGHVLTFIDQEENEQFQRKRGYTEGIGVDRSWRRRGVARALIGRSLQAQKAAGMTESALVADRENASGATRLYESCGFQIARCDTIYRKSL